MILQHGDNEMPSAQIIEKDGVELLVSYVECEYVWSQPTGSTNLSLTDKYLNKYGSAQPAVPAGPSNEESKSAAAMLKERENQLNV